MNAKQVDVQVTASFEENVTSENTGMRSRITPRFALLLVSSFLISFQLYFDYVPTSTIIFSMMEAKLDNYAFWVF